MESFGGKIRVQHVAYSDIDGGASRAAYRVHQSLSKYQKELSLVSRMRVIRKLSNDPYVIGGPAAGDLRFFFQRALNKLSRKLYSLRNKNDVFSTAWPSSGLGNELNLKYRRNQFDILNLHWLGDHTLSIKEIGNLEMPVTWRLPDQWAFSGCEHYSELPQNHQYNYQKGYGNSLKNFITLNINNYSWNLKIKNWLNHINIIAPSNWIAECAKKSQIFEKSFISVIPTPIDLEKWQPIDKKFARNKLSLPINKKIILFGAVGGLFDKRKGGDLLLQTLRKVQSDNLKDTQNYELVVLGEKNGELNFPNNIKTHFMGRINDDYLMRLYYSASDIFILPSRQDNLPGTGLEAHACGLPVAAFDIGGISDIVDHKITGVLVKPFDCETLAFEIKWLLSDKDRLNKLSLNSRVKAERLWNQKRISDLYYSHYIKTIENHRTFKK